MFYICVHFFIICILFGWNDATFLWLGHLYSCVGTDLLVGFSACALAGISFQPINELTKEMRPNGLAAIIDTF